VEQVTESKELAFDVKKLRSEFPILERKIQNQDLVYFDNAASSQKPLRVIKALEKYYTEEHSNVHRGIHTLSQIATAKFEDAREVMRQFLKAKSTKEIIFTKGTTEGINLVAQGLSFSQLKNGDEILISEMEHHSNIVPWQVAAEQSGAKLVVCNVLKDGSLDMDDFENKLTENTKIVSLVHISNTLGTINPVKEICQMARRVGALTLIDGAQSAPHMKINVRDIDCDFYVISGHKMYGPTGIGILYGKEEALDKLLPYQTGGEMIQDVSFEKTTYNELPFRFEAGTPNIAGAIGLAEAVRFIESVGYDNIEQIENSLLKKGHDVLSGIEGIKFLGTSENKASVISFNVDGVHPTDLGTILDKLGIAVRTGHHCTQPLMDKFGIPGTVRVSFAVYNTIEEIMRLETAVSRAVKMLK